MCIRANFLGPVEESLRIPLQILLMIQRHVNFTGAILSHPPIEAAVRADPMVLVKDFNDVLGDTDIDDV